MSHVVYGVNDIETQRPDLLEDWDYELNGDVLPKDIAIGSEKKVWWKCPNGHSYQLFPIQRCKGQKCPLCAGKYCVSGINDLATMRPNLLSEWDEEENTELDPHTLYYKSRKEVHWKCRNGHKWKTKLASRVDNNTNCPYCAGNLVDKGVNDLMTCYPQIAEEWDYDRNSTTPDQMTKASEKRVWWKCKKCGKEWQASISNRTTRHSGCPFCKRYLHTSFPEQAIFYYLLMEFPEVINGYKDCFGNARTEIDVYIPQIKVGIEYDGLAWHNNEASKNRDVKKYEEIKKKGITLIRVSEFEEITEKKNCDFFVKREGFDAAGLTKAICELFRLIDIHIDVDVERDRDAIISRYSKTQDEKSLALRFPEIAAQWAYEKNGEVTPEMLNYTSNKKFWWKCSNNHLWFSSVSNRTVGHGCPYCHGRLIMPEINDLQTKFPSIASEWDEEKNSPLHACDVRPGSVKKYWWICPKGHSYQATPNNRTSNMTGCPVCSGKSIISGINSLKDLKPEYARFWDQEENGSTKISEVSCGARHEYNWICDKGHKWIESVDRFVRRKAECPICSYLWVQSGVNDITQTHPAIVAEWDYERNEGIRPEEYLSKSTKKVWWICSRCQYRWEAQIRLRAVNNTICPKCAYKIKLGETRRHNLVKEEGRSLAERFPEIAKEWDYDENDGLTPSDVSFGSGKMVIWICPKGHKYKAQVSSRTGKQKSGCPVCRYDRAQQTRINNMQANKRNEE